MRPLERRPPPPPPPQRAPSERRGWAGTGPDRAAADPGYRPGSADDFDRLYRDSHPRILATLVGLLRNRALAEDCAQDTFVRAFRAWGRWRPDAPAEAWLHRIAINVAISARRREALRDAGEYVRRLGRPAAASDPSDSSRLDLMAALRRLPVKQSSVIVLRHLHGYTNREIALALGVPERTVASRLAAARLRVRAEVGWDRPPGGTGPGTAAPPGVVPDESPMTR